MPDLTELDRLIEEGLTLYGQGELDGALLVWERALSIDPDNPQANSYVDYVRMNYEMLTTDAGHDESAPFGIAADEPEYQIEILPGEAKPEPGAPMYMDPGDEGWYMDREPDRAGLAPSNRPSEETIDKQIEADPPPVMLELEADEPPLPEPVIEPGGVNFEDATREYEPRMIRATRASTGEPLPKARESETPAINDLFAQETATGEFQPEGTPGFGSPDDVKSFATQVTDVKKRDLGFIKPTQARAPSDPGTPDPDELPAPPVTRARKLSSQAPPTLQMTLRTPTDTDATPVPPPPASSDIALSYEDPRDDSSDDLIASLPSPKKAHVTRDLPSKIVPPASSTASQARISLESFDLGEPELPPEVNVSFTSPPEPQAPEPPATSTRDFSDKPTAEIRHRPRAEQDPLISAPTRELGLRSPANQRARTEDEPTGAKAPLDPRGLRADPGTNADIVLPFDPIDARTQRILEDVDEDAPANEAPDDRTRRRITGLLERATEWSKGTDLDRAVAAVDLALSEDPNSALAQKLIHRNRETIMSVFQSFLGDLERQPVLARPLHELAAAPISPRAAFLLSRVDGTLSLDEILDVSGMPRLEAYRYLCQLFLRGILR